MKTILFFGRWFVPGLTFLLVLSALYSFAPAHATPSHVSEQDTNFVQEPITGTVYDIGGPIPGVTVRVKGTALSTITNEVGEYTIKAPPGSTLVFSYPGYENIEIKVQDQFVIDVELSEIIALQEAVINAGYYTVKDKEKTGSIARVTAKEIENQPVGNVLSAIQGRMAGVEITQSTGVSGSGFNIKIRGTNSLRREGNSPLYIVDGIPINQSTLTTLSGTILPYGDINPLNSLSPNDIESVEVLKDADATAIYGSRGGNGVILITTKQGRKGKVNINFNSSYSMNKVASKMKLLNSEQYLAMRKQAFENDGISEYPSGAYDVNGVWDNTRHIDWQDELLGRIASSSNIGVSIHGGNETTRFMVNLGHSENQSVFSDRFLYKSNNFLGSFQYNSPNGKFEVNGINSFSLQSNNIIQSDLTSQALRLPPMAPTLYNDDGSLNWENNTFTNPLVNLEGNYKNKSYNYNLSYNLKYNPIKWGYFKLQGGMTNTNFEEMALRPHTLYNPAFGLTPESSVSFKNNSNSFIYILEPQMGANHSWAENELDMLVGGTFQQQITSMVEMQGFGFESNIFLSNISAAKEVSVSQDVKSDYRYLAFFGRVNYKYNKKYIINLTGRRDGSSRFGGNNKFANFGAVGMAWLFSEETLFENLKVLSFGKIRASFGLTGSDQIGNYQYLDTYTVGYTQYGGITDLNPSRLSNPKFSWEKNQKKEVAIDLGFFSNKINLTAAWYDNRAGNQLVGIPLPSTTGFNSILANLPATVQNTGWEFDLNIKPFKNNTWVWESNFNISFPKNKLLSFPGIEGSTYANKYAIGQPTSIVKVYNFEGIDPQSGNYMFTDYNDDGIISSPNDNQIIKNIGIQFFGGWNNQLKFRNWDFNFHFQFVKQNQWNYLNKMAMPGTFNNQPVEVLNVWSLDNPNGEYIPYSTIVNQSHLQLMNSTKAISDASFIRLKNVQLSYSIPVDKHFIKEAKVYFQGQNLLTLTNYFGMDPEFTLSGYLPPLKTYAFGFQLNF